MTEKKSSKVKSGRGRTRNFATIVWQESALPDWQAKLAETHIPAFISPIHEKDVEPGGEPKKAHWHVLLMFDGVKTDQQARDVIAVFGGVGCEHIDTLRGYARYLIHMDNATKYQYELKDVISLNGADYQNVIGLPTDKYRIIGEIMDWCEENDIVSFRELMIYAKCDKPDWFRVLCDNGAVAVSKFLKAKSWDNTRVK